MAAAGSVTCCVEPGDLVLFDRRCAPMGPIGASICFGAKALTMTPWDHVGVVVQREDGELCVLDANFSGLCPIAASIIVAVRGRKRQAPQEQEAFAVFFLRPGGPAAVMGKPYH